jgi:hypothetical protein
LCWTPLPHHRGPCVAPYKQSSTRLHALCRHTTQLHPCSTPAAGQRRRAVVTAAAPGSGGTPAQAAATPAALMYSAETAAEEWSRRPVPVVGRLLEIAAAFGSWWVKSSLHRDPQRAAADMRKVCGAAATAVTLGHTCASARSEATCSSMLKGTFACQHVEYGTALSMHAPIACQLPQAAMKAAGSCRQRGRAVPEGCVLCALSLSVRRSVCVVLPVLLLFRMCPAGVGGAWPSLCQGTQAGCRK